MDKGNPAERFLTHLLRSPSMTPAYEGKAPIQAIFLKDDHVCHRDSVYGFARMS